MHGTPHLYYWGSDMHPHSEVALRSFSGVGHIILVWCIDVLYTPSVCYSCSMQYKDDKTGSKLLFFAIAFVVIYSAFFNFDLGAAYRFTIQSVHDFFIGL